MVWHAAGRRATAGSRWRAGGRGAALAQAPKVLDAGKLHERLLHHADAVAHDAQAAVHARARAGDHLRCERRQGGAWWGEAAGLQARQRPGELPPPTRPWRPTRLWAGRQTLTHTHHQCTRMPCRRLYHPSQQTQHRVDTTPLRPALRRTAAPSVRPLRCPSQPSSSTGTQSLQQPLLNKQSQQPPPGPAKLAPLAAPTRPCQTGSPSSRPPGPAKLAALAAPAQPCNPSSPSGRPPGPAPAAPGPPLQSPRWAPGWAGCPEPPQSWWAGRGREARSAACGVEESAAGGGKRGRWRNARQVEGAELGARWPESRHGAGAAPPTAPQDSTLQLCAAHDSHSAAPGSSPPH